MGLLQISALTRRPWFEAFRFELEPGEIVCLRGPSGCGKTLLLRAIADLDPVDAGELSLEGVRREDFEPREWRRRVAYVHQGGVRLQGTVADNLDRIRALAVARRSQPAPVSEGRDSSTLDLAADAQQLSGGEAQSLALLRALAIGPRVLLLDEPTSALDEERASQWCQRLRTFARAGNAVLWVTHDARLVTELGARELAPW